MFNIMIVEDDANQRKLMGAVLEQYGYNVIQAFDGVDALDQLDKKHVDLIILDIMMPRMDGFELTETLRNKEKRGSLLWVLDKTKTAMGARCLLPYSTSRQTDSVWKRLPVIQALSRPPCARAMKQHRPP